MRTVEIQSESIQNCSYNYILIVSLLTGTGLPYAPTDTEVMVYSDSGELLEDQSIQISYNNNVVNIDLGILAIGRYTVSMLFDGSFGQSVEIISSMHLISNPVKEDDILQSYPALRGNYPDGQNNWYTQISLAYKDTLTKISSIANAPYIVLTENVIALFRLGATIMMLNTLESSNYTELITNLKGEFNETLRSIKIKAPTPRTVSGENDNLVTNSQTFSHIDIRRF